jgi:excisionase family DNA binding protein
MGTNNNHDTKRFLTTDEASRYLAVSGRTLERWRLVGEGPPFSKLGALCRYAVDDLDRWAASTRRNSTSDPGPELHPPV